MRLNRFIAAATGSSRRKADELIEKGKITINGEGAEPGAQVNPNDEVRQDGSLLKLPLVTTIALHKPKGYVCSRNGQGSKTVYDLLPAELHHLKPVGRLDKDSSGLLLMTNDGSQANKLTHPKYGKEKIYEVRLNKTLTQRDEKKLLTGVVLEDGLSKFKKVKIHSSGILEVTLAEGRNRQIRRTFQALDYKVTSLHRTEFGDFSLGTLKPANWHQLKIS